MTAYNLDVYMPVVILITTAIVMVLGAFIVSRILRPSKPSELKSTPYECGELPVGAAWSNFNVRFYVLALVFIIFDVEAALIFPVAVIFNRFSEIGEGGIVLVTFLLFISILVEGIVYCWKKGDLDWVKTYGGKSVNSQRDKKNISA